MVATWSPAASSRYYTQQTEYYLADGTPSGRWYSPSKQFQVTDGAAVHGQQFEQLFAGLGANGESLLSNARADRVPAFDVTLSAPRSVSLLWAFGSPETRTAIEQAQAQAARATLHLLEREAAYARRGRGGAHLEKIPLTAACFQHSESRPAEHADGRVFADPNTHTHCVVLNISERPDGTCGALHSTVLRDWKMGAGAMYHAALAYELQNAGFAIDRLGKNGVFEIAGVNATAIQYFSARRAEIEQALAEAGTTSPESSALAAALAKSTRHSKLDNSVVDQHAQWRDAANANGIVVEQFEQHAREAALQQNAPAFSIAERLAALPTELTQTQSVIDRRELLRAATAALVGSGLSPEQITASIDQLIERSDFIALGTDAIGQPRYSTVEMIRVEREVVQTAARLAQTSWRSIAPTTIQRLCDHQKLSTEQTAAALTATTGYRVATIEGAPGAGKTTMLTPIVAAYRDAGCRVLGAASAWRIANMLRDDLQIKSRAVASWLEQVRRGMPFLDARTLLIVDEAGLLSSRDMHTLLQAVEKSGAKLLLVGDRDQLQSIGAGPGLSLVARAVEQARVSTIVRQKDAWAREAITAFGQGEAVAALEAFAAHDRLIDADGARAAVCAVVDQWEHTRHQHPDATQLLIAKTNAEVSAISREVRSRLRALGVVHGAEIQFQATTTSGHVTDITFAAGDHIRFLTRNDALRVINGTTGTVVRVTEHTNQHGATQRIVVDVEGRWITFSPRDLADDKGRARLGWAYASTIYGCQGLTVDHAAVLLNPSFDRHDIYVAASRARYSTALVSDKKMIDQHIRLTRAAAKNNFHATISEHERRAWLAERLARSNVKESTLDVIDLEQLSRAAQLSRVREHALEAELER